MWIEILPTEKTLPKKSNILPILQLLAFVYLKCLKN